MYNKKILLIGSLPKENISQLGGATILMKSLKDYFDEKKVFHDFICLNEYPFSRFRSLIFVVFKYLQKVYKSDLVFINVSTNGAFLVTPILYLIGRFFSKKIVFRVFGSNFQKHFLDRNKVIRFFAKKTFFKSDLVIVETLYNQKFFLKNEAKEILILPNVRKRPKKDFKVNEFSKSFVFISQVKINKGILDIIQASQYLNKTYTIDVFGPLYDNLTKENIDNDIVTYKGVLKPEEVINKIELYDVVLLPTYYYGEGHPGILVEAMSLGKPIISTYWNSIEEIVDNNYNGFLVSIKSPLELSESIKKFNENNYKEMSMNSYKKFDFFDEELVYKKLMIELAKV
ncbi:glycosyltransferase [Tenacibaculum singaporense]|uniref:Glycosyltransferase n=1 Tax=Tenacibaculum singaporense TaxID=2358479 RepID=A0A3S8R5J1_9FLAO|nr:glycosyltransferase [Tenacibaculum singaporense]AZJ35036.1 glycosyltransferase [Tenacibaculum singaporense]